MKKSLIYLFIIFTSCTDERPEEVIVPDPVSLLSINLAGNDYSFDRGRLNEHELSGIFVTITTIEIMQNEEWIEVPTDNPRLVNLIDLSKQEKMLAVYQANPGVYSQIRFSVEEGKKNVILEGQGSYVKNKKGFIYPLKVPSSSIRIVNKFVIDPGKPVKLILNFDVNKSIVQQGKKEEYLLKPVISLKTDRNTGFINVSLSDSFHKGNYKLKVFESGKFNKNELTNDNEKLAEKIIYMSSINATSSGIIVPNLSEGAYDIYVAAQSEGLSDHFQKGIIVRIGEITDLVL
ncbi:MAG: DUF4382 domain-containing protein [Cyclobacteriaceae bacterium]